MGKYFAGGFGLVYLSVCILLLIGWFMNAWHCIGYATGTEHDDTAMKIIHLVGIIVAPIGGVAGWF